MQQHANHGNTVLQEYAGPATNLIASMIPEVHLCMTTHTPLISGKGTVCALATHAMIV